MALIASVNSGVIDSSVSTGKTSSSSSSSTVGTTSLGYEQFLQLLTAEMQYQDPLEPTSNTDYVAQMATFSQLEATLSMKEALTESTDTSTKNMANALVGKEVIVADSDSSTGYSNGIVDYVMYEDDEIYVSVNNKLYSLDDVDTVSTEEYYEAVVAAKNINTMLGELPKLGELTASNKSDVENIRKVYDGLTDYQKKYVDSDDVTRLEQYEEKLKELEKKESSTLTDEIV